jgi:hypothetical protein
MKKFVFAALAAIFMMSSGFVDNNTIPVEDFYDCHYSITRTSFGPQGQVYKEKRRYFAIVDNAYACGGVANMHLTNIVMGNRPW